MISYRISKYNPQYRDSDGAYKKNEWTSICDIGKIFPEGILNENEYYETENKYVNTFREIIEFLNIDVLYIRNFEKHKNFSRTSLYKKHRILSVDEACVFLTLCLRENCWGRLKAKQEKQFCAYVGYDYYLHIDTVGNFCAISDIATKNNLFCEMFCDGVYKAI